MMAEPDTQLMDAIIKGGLGVIVAAILIGVLYMGHLERQKTADNQTRLISQLMGDCLSLKDNATQADHRMDHMLEFFGLDPESVDMNSLDRELELLANAPNN
jgi:hypothetical protein